MIIIINFIYYSVIEIECHKFYRGLNDLEISQKETENSVSVKHIKE